jgi:pantothenate kinase-related protein Tda10
MGRSSDLIQWATATAAFHNSDELFNRPKCHPNTRLAALSKIMKWIKQEGGLNTFIMWMYGPAGAGKSAIAQTITEMPP